MTPTTSQYHAIVLGGSMAGLLAARVLSNHFDHVTIVERDPLRVWQANRRLARQAGRIAPQPATAPPQLANETA